MMRIRTAAIWVAFAGVFSLLAAGAGAQTAPQGIADRAGVAACRRPMPPRSSRFGGRRRGCGSIPVTRRNPTASIRAIIPGRNAVRGVQRDLRAGIPAERHGDRAAHELLLAPRLDAERRAQRRSHGADQPGADHQCRAAINDDRHDELREVAARCRDLRPGPERRSAALAGEQGRGRHKRDREWANSRCHFRRSRPSMISCDEQSCRRYGVAGLMAVLTRNDINTSLCDPMCLPGSPGFHRRQQPSAEFLEHVEETRLIAIIAARSII